MAAADVPRDFWEAMPDDDATPARGIPIPTDPAELEAWKERFTQDLADGPPAQWIGVPWDDRA